MTRITNNTLPKKNSKNIEEDAPIGENQHII